MAEVFLQEGKQELPVEGDYADWQLAQKRRLGAARERWIAKLATAGWGMDQGCGSLAYLRPDLLDEYDVEHDENPRTLPFTGSVTSPQSVWWRCSRDESHQWRTSIRNRHIAGTGCPRCGKKGVSRREQEVFTALQALLPALASPGTAARHTSQRPDGRRLRSWRVDMLLPGTRPVVVEYDGAYWHQDAFQRDQEKAADLAASGHVVIRIREQPLPAVTPNDVVCTADESAEAVAKRVYEKILDLTGAAFCEPPGEPGPAEQLELFSGTTEAAGERSAAESPAVRLLVKEALLHSHATGVNIDRALGEYLAGELSVTRACMKAAQGLGGTRALLLALSKLMGGH
ncbi:zinc-ribbon domain-containing protein [Streptomyces sp. NPDC051993]|uniref:zinc-ribbon domain-containing protein n=1 Tax=Streptomyces sp. NPDC051993 TaxID=3155286 RepID=UPI003421351C